MSGEKRIDINVGGRADLTQAGGEISKFRTLINELKKDVASVGSALKEAKQNWRDLALVGAAHAGKQAMDYTRQLTTSNLSGGAMYGKVAGGLSQYRDHIIQIDNEARAVKRLGEAYRDYHRDLIASGRPYGFSNGQVLALASMYGSTNGRAGAGRLTDDMRVTQGMARAYGMQATEAGSYLNQANKAGIIGPGGDIASMRQFSGLLADAISAGRMQGREGEVMSSVVELTRSINSQRIDVKGTDLAARALTTLNATGIRGLQGDQGAALLGRMDNAIKNPGGGEAGDLFMYRALTNGQGGMSLADYSYLKEEGLAGQTPDGRSNLQAVMEQVNKMPISGRYRLMAASNLTGMSMHQYEGLENAFMKDGKFDMAKLGGLRDALGQDMGGVDASVWGLLADLQNGADVGAVGREFSQLSGQTAATNKDELFNQIKQYGQGNVALSEGQQREKLDADMGKAAEDAASKLYGLQTAADELAKKFLEVGGSLPGPLGGVAPIMLGSAMGGLLQKGGSLAMGRGADILGRVLGGGGSAAAEAAGTEAAAAGAAGGTGGSLLGRIAPYAAGAATFAGGVGLGAAAAYGGSLIGQSVYGTQSFLGGEHRAALGQGWNNLTSGNTSWGDWGNALGGVAMAAPGVIAGTLYGAYRNATGQQDFASAYRDGFFTVDRFDSTGRQQWIDSNKGGGGGGAGWGDQGDQLQIAKIDKILSGSGMAGKGALLLSLSRRYGVPVELALAQFAKEAQFNTTGVAPKNNNPGNLRYTGNWGDDRPGEGGFAHFPTVEAGIEGYFMLLGTSKTYAKELQYGKQTGDWSALVNKYAPPSENNSQQYSDQMAAWTQKYHQQIVGSSAGGWWDVPADDMPTLLHRKEMVLPAHLADPLRNMITGPQLSASDARQGAGMIQVQIAPIQIQMPDGSTQTVNAAGSYVPFDGVIAHPILSSR